MKFFSALIFMLLVACQGSGNKAKSNFLKKSLATKVSTLDPALSYDTVSAQVVYQIHEPLFEYEYLIRPYTLRPLLAQSMPEISKDAKTYTIKIKKGVKYHSHPALKENRTVKAQDFITQIKRLAYLKTQSNGWWLFDNKIIGLNDFRKKAQSINDFEKIKVEGLRAIDEHTLQIKLIAPYPQLKFALAMSFTAPVPMELVRHYDNFLSDHPVGTGPFVFKKWDKNLAIFLERNPEYNHSTYPQSGDRVANESSFLKDAGNPLPFIDGIRFSIIREARPRMQNFLQGNIDYVTLDKDYFPMALDYTGKLSKEYAKKNIQLHTIPSLTYYWLSFNMNHELLGKNLKLRQAIAHAIDRNKFVELFTNNVGLKANSIFPPGIPGYDPTVTPPFDFNIEKAKFLLKEAGYPEGKGLPQLSYDVRGASSLSRQMGEFIQSQLGKIGINISVIMNTFPAFLEKAKAGKLDFWLDGWSLDYPDAQNVIQLLASSNHPPGPNTTYYSNPVIDKIFEDVSTGVKSGDLVQMMKKVENEVSKDLPWIMLYYYRSYVLVHERVKNFRESDLIYNTPKYLRLK